jgi:hypothetical protein
VQAVSGEFQQAFELLGRRAESEKVPADVRERLEAAAAVERRNADEIEQIAPVEGSEAAVDEFVRAARSHADRLDAAAAQPDLTVAEMADTIERGELREALEALARQGLVEPPGHQ